MNKATVVAEPGQSTFRIERIFDAPREAVFAAMTDAGKVAKWWTGPGYACKVETLEPRTGGAWKYVQTSPDGQEFTFFGLFHEVAHEKGRYSVTQTTAFSMAGMPGPTDAAQEKMELLEQPDGKTKMVVISAFLNAKDRDMMLENGMEDGMNQSYANLDKVLAEG